MSCTVQTSQANINHVLSLTIRERYPQSPSKRMLVASRHNSLMLIYEKHLMASIRHPNFIVGKRETRWGCAILQLSFLGLGQVILRFTVFSFFLYVRVFGRPRKAHSFVESQMSKKPVRLLDEQKAHSIGKALGYISRGFPSELPIYCQPSQLSRSGCLVHSHSSATVPHQVIHA